MIQSNNKIVFLLLFVSSVLSDNCKYADNCNAEDGRMFTITCVRDATPGDCVCEGKDDDSMNTEGCISGWSALGLISYETIFEECVHLCEDVEEASGKSLDCAFYKYNQDITEQVSSRNCYLMDKTQCSAASNTPCHPDQCESGGIICEEYFARNS